MNGSNCRLKVVENRCEVFVNGTKVVDYIQPDDPYRPKNDKLKVFSAGRNCTAMSR